MKHTAQVGLGFVLSLGLLALPAVAQDTQSNSQSQSGDSLGNYARQIRKDGGQTKARPKVFDNDNLPREDKLSVVGKATEAETVAQSSDTKNTEGTAAAGDNKAPTASQAPAANPDQEQAQRQAAYKQWQAKIAGQKDQIELLQRELDVLQREYQIRAAAMYADAGNRIRNSADWDKKDTEYKQQIADKQKAVDDAKQKLDDIEEEARKAGVPSAMRD